MREHHQRKSAFALARPLLAFAAALPAIACAPLPEDVDDVSQVDSPIIGGTTLSVATRRSLGLVDVSAPSGSCSGMLITPHWAITATHCLDLTVPSNNRFSIPRTDGVLETRIGGVVSRVGTTDISVVSLQQSNTVTQWPTPIRTVLRNPVGNGMVGQTVTCYGRGANAYKSPSGLTVDGVWRSLTKTIASFDGSRFVINAVNGNQTPAPGDSGGACLSDSQIVGVVSQATNVVCADPSTDATCKATITRVDGAFLTSAQPYADYIGFAGTRSASANFAPLTLVNGWTNAPYSTNNAGYTVFDGSVHLRGAIATSGTTTFAFQLPSNARPVSNVYVPVNLCNGKKGRLSIRPDGTTTVQAETAWSDAQCFTSLEGVSFVKSNTFDTRLMLTNGWTGAPYGTGTPAAHINFGVVRLSGAMSGGASGSAFTLPAAFRPAATVYLPVDLCNASKGRLVIGPTGEAFVYAETDFGNAQCFTSLDGVTFDRANSLSPLTPLNGWSGAPYSTRVPAATNVLGTIRFQGAVWLPSGANTQILSLQAHMRPATNVYIPVDMCSGATGRIIVRPDGGVLVQSATTFDKASCFTSLEGAFFGL